MNRFRARLKVLLTSVYMHLYVEGELAKRHTVAPRTGPCDARDSSLEPPSGSGGDL